MFDISIYPDLLRMARPLTLGKNFDPEDLVHEIYLKQYDFSMTEKGKVMTALRKVAWFESNTSVDFLLNHKIRYREYICCKCKEPLPVAAFRIRTDKTGFSYVENICGDCSKKAHKEYYFKNTDKHKTGMAQYRKNNAEKLKESKRAWYLANRERLIKKSGEYQKAHKKGSGKSI